MQETSLHAALKNLYSLSPGDQQEVPVDGYLVDVVQGELLVEIQTRNFSAIKEKLASLLMGHKLLLVHPIAQQKWLLKLPAEGESPIEKRKSPRRGRLEHIFLELVRIPHLVTHPNFSLEILLTREEEIRRNDGLGSWRRKGWSIGDRYLLEIISRRRFNQPSDYLMFIPPDLAQPFTSLELAQALSIPRYLAQKTVYCLRNIGVLRYCGRRGRAYLYQSES
jgi:hypothetical protein